MTRRPPVKNRPSHAELRRLYVDEGRTCPQIALSVGCDPTTVHHWLVAAGIPTRPRGDIANMGGKRRSPDWRPTAAQVENVRAATIRRGGVPYLRNGKHWLKGAPPEMNPRWLGGATPDRQEFYRSPEWKEACVTVWWRSDACCEKCGADSRKVQRIKRAFHIHHIVTFQNRDLRASVGNLVLLCKACHLWAHSRANAERLFLASDAGDLIRWRAEWDRRCGEIEVAAWARMNEPDPEWPVRYLTAAEAEVSTPTLFDLLEGEAA